jgi:hypothetical protein
MTAASGHSLIWNGKSELVHTSRSNSDRRISLSLFYDGSVLASIGRTPSQVIHIIGYLDQHNKNTLSVILLKQQGLQTGYSYDPAVTALKNCRQKQRAIVLALDGQ